MLRPEVDEHVLALEFGLNRQGRFECRDTTAFIHDEWRALRAPFGIEPGRGEGNFDRALFSHAYSPVFSPPARRCRISSGRSSNASAIVSSVIEYRLSGCAASA